MCELAFLGLMGFTLYAAAALEPNEPLHIKHTAMKTATYVRRNGQVTVNIELDDEPTAGHLVEVVLRVYQPGKKVKIYNVDIEM